MNGWLRRLRGAMLILVFLSVFLYIFSLNFRLPSRMDFLQRFVVETVGPPVSALGRISSGVEDVVKSYVWLTDVRRENEALKQQVASLEQKVTDYHEAYIENLRLRRLLDFKLTIEAETVCRPRGRARSDRLVPDPHGGQGIQGQHRTRHGGGQ